MGGQRKSVETTGQRVIQEFVEGGDSHVHDEEVRSAPPLPRPLSRERAHASGGRALWKHLSRKGVSEDGIYHNSPAHNSLVRRRMDRGWTALVASFARGSAVSPPAVWGSQEKASEAELARFEGGDDSLQRRFDAQSCTHLSPYGSRAIPRPRWGSCLHSTWCRAHRIVACRRNDPGKSLDGGEGSLNR